MDGSTLDSLLVDAALMLAVWKPWFVQMHAEKYMKPSHSCYTATKQPVWNQAYVSCRAPPLRFFIRKDEKKMIEHISLDSCWFTEFIPSEMLPFPECF